LDIQGMIKNLRPRLHDLFESKLVQRIEAEANAHPQWADVCNVYGLALACQTRFEEAEVQFRTSLAANPRYSWAHLNLITVLSVQEKFREARKFLDTCGEPAVGAKLVVEASMALLEEKPATAEAVVHRMTPTLLDRPDVLLLRSLIADASGQDSFAADLLGQLHGHREWSELSMSYESMDSQSGPQIGLFPGMHYLWRRASKIYAYDEAPEKARSAAELAYYYWSDRGMHVTHLGMLHSLQGEFDVAAACYEQGMRLSPTDPEPAAALASYWAAHGDADQAVGFLEEAVKRAPGYPDLFRRLGALESARKNDRAALAAFERALEINPLFTGARLEMAETLSRLERWREAIKAFQGVLDAGLDSADIQIQLGQCYEAKGATQKALVIFKSAALRYPEDTRPRKCLSNLNAGEERKAS
jgi:tetratricopeptide (TPR) repeat protein